MASPYKRVQIIVNPAAGKDEPILNIINSTFQGTDIAWDVSITRKFGDATQMTKDAVAEGVDLVAGYGGDGTQLEVANGLVGSGVPMAILPGGTGNAMAFALNVSRNLPEAMQLIVDSPNRRAIDMAQIGEQYFMLRAYTGVQPEERASRESKNRFGNLAYVMEGLKFATKPPEAKYHVTIDGERAEGIGLIAYIVNAGTTGGVALPELAAAEVDDGLLDLYILTHGLKPLRALSEHVFNIGNWEAGVYHWQGEEITLEADPPQSVWIDGEEYGSTPITAKILPKVLEVVVP
jgi:YegS/Rv2252/BmrU family lipid kinase